MRGDRLPRMLEGLTVFTSWGQLAAAGGVLVLAQLVYVMLGFGSGLIAVGLLAFVLPEVRDVVVLLPAVLLGAWLGHRIHLELPEATFRRLVSAALALIGAVLLARVLG